MVELKSLSSDILELGILTIMLLQEKKSVFGGKLTMIIGARRIKGLTNCDNLTKIILILIELQYIIIHENKYYITPDIQKIESIEQINYMLKNNITMKQYDRIKKIKNLKKRL